MKTNVTRVFLIAVCISLLASTGLFATGGGENGATGALGANEDKYEGFLPELMEKYGLKVEWETVAWMEIPPKLTTMIMAGDSPDLTNIGNNLTFPQIAVEGLIQPLDPYIDMKNFKESPLFKDVMEGIDSYAWKGQHYSLPSWQNTYIYVWYNKNLFEQNGLTTPLEYLKRGEWTWDTMRDLAIKLTQDTNNDGTIDIYGLGNNPGPDMWLPSTGVPFIASGPEGLMTYMKDPRIARAMNYLQDLGPTKRNVMSFGWSFRQEFPLGKIAMAVDGVFFKQLFAKDMAEDELDFVIFPKDPQSSSYNLEYNSGGLGLVKGSKNPTGAIAYQCVARYTGLDEELAQLGLDSMIVRNLLTDEQGLRRQTPGYIAEGDPIVEHQPVIHSTYAVGDFTWGVFYPMMDELVNQGVSWSSLVDKYYPILSKNIEDVNTQ